MRKGNTKQTKRATTKKVRVSKTDKLKAKIAVLQGTIKKHRAEAKDFKRANRRMMKIIVRVQRAVSSK
jgi:hypothetical protein